VPTELARNLAGSGPDGKCLATDVIGGAWPVSSAEFARRAYLHAANPLRNPLKEVMDNMAGGDVRRTPPMLGIFSDIPWHQIRESEVHAWARAGITWVVCDGEHSLTEGRYGREQLSLMLRLGITPVQRFHREARSLHGDALTMGCRATMMPYGTTVGECAEYYKCVSYPTVGSATPFDRGGFPMRLGDRQMLFTPDSLKSTETETQGWIQFETGEYILDEPIRDQVLDVMKAQGPNKACGFIGPFDAVMRCGVSDTMAAACNGLISAAADRGVFMGRVVGSGSCSSEEQIEAAMVEAINAGCRLICVHYMTSDLTFMGAQTAARPFWNACTKSGF